MAAGNPITQGVLERAGIHCHTVEIGDRRDRSGHAWTAVSGPACGQYGRGDERFYSSYFGADAELVRELRRFCDGAQPVATARDGLEATRMVEGALRSMDEGGVAVDMDSVPDAMGCVS